MTLPIDIADRLRALEISPERYEEIVRSEGDEFVRRFIGKLEDADRLYHEWAPRLREFAALSRLRNPCPEVGTLNARDEAKLCIFESLITRAERLPQRHKKEVLICSIPLVGIPVAMKLWPGEDDRSVFLTPDELSAWDAIYKHPDESFWWFTNYVWHVEDPPRPNTLWSACLEPKLPDDLEPWLVVDGLSWGSLAGGETGELWSWNGEQARFVEMLGCWNS